MAFLPGQSGNPNGRPRGIIDCRAQMRSLLHDHAKDLVEKLIDMAKAGDPTAMKLCIERLIPRLKQDETITFELPVGHLDSPDNIIKIAENITMAVTTGHMSINEAKELTQFIDSQRDSIKEAELEKD